MSLAHFIPNDLAILIIFAIFGYILSSIDLIFIFENIMKMIEYRNTVFPVESIAIKLERLVVSFDNTYFNINSFDRYILTVDKQQ